MTRRFACTACILLTLLLAAGLTAGCAGAPAGAAESQKKLIVSNIEVEVDERIPIDIVTAVDGTVSFSFDGDGIAVYDGCVRGMVAGTETVVKATAPGYAGTFTVHVTEDAIAPSEAAAVSVAAVDGLTDAFAMGMDVSTLSAVLAGGGKFYDTDGNRVSVYRLLKENGVNWLRLRLWNEPYQTGADGEKLYYGGGNCDLETVTALARDAKALGFSLLLDFHYSDFWADPSCQIIPKMWKDIASADEMAIAIYDYTYETLRALDQAGGMPDMVQIGNELTSGMLLSEGGAEDGTFAGSGYSGYVSKKTDAPAAVRAAYSGRGAEVDQTLVKYVSAGADAVRAYCPDTRILLQLAMSMSDVAGQKKFFHTFDSVAYDVIGLSYYPCWHGGVTELRQALAALLKEFSDKQICVAEFSYGYTLEQHPYATNQFNSESALKGYDISVEGQTALLRDVIATVASIDRGLGVFYWEGAWLPVEGAGWASARTKCSWANQALFDYEGRVLPSLAAFAH